MPDLSFIKPASDIQYIGLMVVFVLLAPKIIPIISKKLKFKDAEKDGKNAGDCPGECQKEDVLEGILKQLSDLGRDVVGLASELKAQATINDERHDGLKEQIGRLTSQIGSVDSRVNDIYSILLKQYSSPMNSNDHRHGG